ncbi:hypothetical protein EXIGLDRAFT_308434 [Exidia glandulosa HHB12029]|uniref:Uncharacterized protein n=1 Tax=Exidia glandulosa HHB12029 TaxID=1314781 RepID=A0A165LW99_EXIGL|nr:hypothetical protein EXIGLDRAFT_308434 [Exidia glandulosa HHB12029]
MLITALLHVILHFAVQLQVLVSQQYANLPSAWQLATALGVDRALYDLDTRMHSALDNIWLRPTRTIAFNDYFEWHVQDDVARIIAPDSSVAIFTDNYGYFYTPYDAAELLSGSLARGGRPRKSDVRVVLLLYMLAMATGIALSATHRVNKIPTSTGYDFERPVIRPSAIAPLQSMPVVSPPAAVLVDFQDAIVPEADPFPDIVHDVTHSEPTSSPLITVDVALPPSPSPSTIGLYSEEDDVQATPAPVHAATSLKDDEVRDEDDEPAQAAKDDGHQTSPFIANLSSDDRDAVQPCSTLLDDAPSSSIWIPAPVVVAGPSQSDGDYDWDEISSAPMESLKDELRKRVLRFRSESSPDERPDTDVDLDLQDPIAPDAGPIICVVDTTVHKEDRDSPSLPLLPGLLRFTDPHVHHDRELEQASSSDQVPPTSPSVPLPSTVDELPRSVFSTTDPDAHHDREVEQLSSSDDDPTVQANDLSLNFIPPPPPPPAPLDFSFTQWILHDGTLRKDAYVHLRKVEEEPNVNVRRSEPGCRMRTGHRLGVKVVLTPNPAPLAAPTQPDIRNVVVVVRPPVRDLEALGWESRALSEVDGRYDLDLEDERDADSGLFPYPQLGEEPPSDSSMSEAEGSHLVDTATPSRSPTPVITPEGEGSGDLIGIPVSQTGYVSVLPESAATQEEDDMIPQAVHVRGTTSTVSAVVSVAVPTSLASALPVTVDSESLVTTPASAPLKGTQLQVLRTVGPSNGMATVSGAVDGVSISPPLSAEGPTVTTGRTLLPVMGSSDSPQVSSRLPTPILTPEKDSSGHAQFEGGRARGTTLIPVAGSSTGHGDAPQVPSRSPTPILTPEDEVRDDSSRGRARGTTLRATVSESNVEAERRELEILVNLRGMGVATNVPLRASRSIVLGQT